jgi:hypothetical protein
MGRARDLANILSSSGSVALDSEMGLVSITPASIAVTSGSGSISSNGTVTFSSATSVSLNNIFSSSFTNYKIVINITSGNGSFYTRLRAGGTVNTSAVYNNYSHYGRSGNANAVLTANENATEAALVDNISSATFDSMDIFNPNVNTNTHSHFQGLHVAPSTNGYRVMSHWGGWSHNASYQADGITFYFGTSGTGDLKVYGYRI